MMKRARTQGVNTYTSRVLDLLEDELSKPVNERNQEVIDLLNRELAHQTYVENQIADELRKPRDQQNQELLSFWLQRDARPSTPLEFKDYVYCFVGLHFGQGLEEKTPVSFQPLGTACAIHDTVVYTAFHNIGDASGFDAFAITSSLSRSRKHSADALVQVDLIASDTDEDWALLRRQSGTFEGKFCSRIIWEEDRLPASQSAVAIIDWPVGGLTSVSSNNLEVDVHRGRISWYENQNADPEAVSSNSNSWKIIQPSARPAVPAVPKARVAVRGPRCRGSCGGPYVTFQRELLAFHVESFDDSDEAAQTASARSVAINTGKLFSGCPKLKAAYGTL